jgi:hypothetical protein
MTTLRVFSALDLYIVFGPHDREAEVRSARPQAGQKFISAARLHGGGAGSSFTFCLHGAAAHGFGYAIANLTEQMAIGGVGIQAFCSEHSACELVRVIRGHLLQPTLRRRR